MAAVTRRTVHFLAGEEESGYYHAVIGVAHDRNCGYEELYEELFPSSDRSRKPPRRGEREDSSVGAYIVQWAR